MPDYWQNLVYDRDALVDDSRRVEPITDRYMEMLAEEERRRLPDPPSVLTRIVQVGAAEAATRLEEWAGGGTEVVAIPAPAGVDARERRHRDTRPAADGTPRMRRQRIAVSGDEERAWIAYWSAPEPVEPGDEVPWHRAIARLGGRSISDGWTA